MFVAPQALDAVYAKTAETLRTGTGPDSGLAADTLDGAHLDEILPGLDCWDYNLNGVCDLGTEDIDSSGACDVADCKGPQGDVGATGPAGPQGPQRDVGATGPAGADG